MNYRVLKNYLLICVLLCVSVFVYAKPTIALYFAPSFGFGTQFSDQYLESFDSKDSHSIQIFGATLELQVLLSNNISFRGGLTGSVYGEKSIATIDLSLGYVFRFFNNRLNLEGLLGFKYGAIAYDEIDNWGVSIRLGFISSWYFTKRFGIFLSVDSEFNDIIKDHALYFPIRLGITYRFSSI